MKELSIIVPVYNEENSIEKFIVEVEKNVPPKCDYEIVFCMDPSTDNTENLVREFSKKDSRVRLISRIDRFGLSSAIKEGCLNARGDIIAVMDSDGQHEVRSLVSALDYLSNNNEDIVIGSRIFRKDATKTRILDRTSCAL